MKKIIGIIAAIIAGAALITAGIIFIPKLINKPAPVEEPVYPEGITWYNIHDTEFSIDNKQMLLDVVTLSENGFDFKGQTLKLTTDITLNEGVAADWKENAPSFVWNPIKGFAGTFDGQDHTIFGLYMFGTDSRLAMFLRATEDATIQNLNIKNSYIGATGMFGAAAFCVWSNCTLIRCYTDIIIDIDGGFAAGIASRYGGHLVSECWFDGVITTTARYGGCITDVLEDKSTTVIEHCLNTGVYTNTWNVSSSSIGGMCACIFNGTDLKIIDCFSDGQMILTNKVRNGSILGGGDATCTLTVTDCFASQETYPDTVSAIYYGTIDGGALAVPHKRLIGDLGFQWTLLDFENHWTTVKDSSPRLKSYTEESEWGTYAGLEKGFDTSWYDENKNSFEIKNLNQLYGFAMLSYMTNFSGKTIKLANDIVVTPGHENFRKWRETPPEDTMWLQIGNSAHYFAGTFEGQGHTISGIYFLGGTYSGMFAYVDKTAVIRNFSLLDSYFYCSNNVSGCIAGRGNGTYEKIYTNAIMYGDGEASNGLAGICGQVQDGYGHFSEIWWDGEVYSEGTNGQQSGGIIGQIVNSAGVALSHCLATGTVKGNRVSGFNNLGGVVGFVNNASELDISDTLSTALVIPGKTEAGKDNGGCGVLIGQIGAGSRCYIANLYATTDRFSKVIGSTNGTAEGAPEAYKNAAITGYKAYQWMALDFDKYWAVDLNGTPVLQQFATSVPSLEGVERMFDTSWYRRKETTFVLSNAKQMYGFQKLSLTNTFKDKTILLGADITLNSGTPSQWLAGGGIPWAGLCSSGKPFEGTFNGQGHTITGLFVDAGDQCKGLFNATSNDAVITNLRMDNSYIRNDANAVGAIAGRGNGTYSNIYVGKGVTVECTAEGGSAVGGIVGQVQQKGTVNSITNCHFAGTVRETGSNAQQIGGIVGNTFYPQTLYIRNCLVTGHIEVHRASGHCNAGGIIGLVSNAGEVGANCVIEDCLFAGSTDTSKGGSGSIIGQISPGETGTLRRVYYITDNLCKNTSGVIGAKNGTAVGDAEGYAEQALTGVLGYQWTELNFNTYWAADPNGSPKLRSFFGAGMSLAGVERAFDTTWYNPSQSVFTITNARQLAGLAKLSKSDRFENKTFLLGNDIAFNDGDASTWGTTPPANTWSGIGVQASSFNGTFDGQNHTISGLYGEALFGANGAKSVVKNLNIKNSYHIKSGADIASVSDMGGGTYQHVYSNATVEMTSSRGGGIMGRCDENNTVVTDCWFDGQIIGTGDNVQQAGGIVGSVFSSKSKGATAMTIQHCLNTASITLNRTLSGFCNAGGIIGYLGDVNACGHPVAATVIDCFTTGVITTNQGGTGSVVGQVGAGCTCNLEKAYTTTEACSKGTVGSTNGTRNGAPMSFSTALLKGTSAYKMTELDFTSYWACIEAATPRLLSFTDSSLVLSLEGVEKDFDLSWYDAANTEFVLTTPAQLLGFAVLSQSNNFAGKTVKLGNDITLNEGDISTWGEGGPALAWIPTGTFNGTFDGQGYTVSGLYVNGSDDMTAMFGRTGENAVIKNFKLVNSYFRSSAAMRTAAVVGRASGRIEKVYTDAHVENTHATGQFIGGIVGEACDGALVISNVEFAGRVTTTGTTKSQMVGGILGAIIEGPQVTIEHSHFSGYIVTGGKQDGFANVAGFVGIITDIVSPITAKPVLNLTDCVSSGTIVGGGTGGVGSFIGQAFGPSEDAYATVNISNCFGPTGTAKNVKADGSETQRGAVGYAAPNARVSGGATLLPATIAKGLDAYKFSDLDFTNYWYAINGDAPHLQAFTDPSSAMDVSGTDRVSLAWYNDSQTEFTLTSASDLIGLSLLSQTSNMAGKTFKLANDIVFNEDHANFRAWEFNAPDNSWLPIGTFGTMKFKGTIDGQGHSIYGLYTKSAAEGTAFIAEADNGAVVKNLNILNSYFESTAARLAVVAGRATATLENIYTNAMVVSRMTTGTSFTGGFIGQSAYAGETSLKNCWFDGTVLSGAQGFGGLVGTLNSASPDQHMTIENCLFTGTVYGGLTGAANNAGGIVGYVFYSGRLTLKNTISAGTVIGSGVYNSPVIGQINGSVNGSEEKTNVTFENVYAVKGSASTITGAVPGVGVLVNTPTVTGTVTEITKAALLSDAGAACPALDFTETFTATANALPALKVFNGQFASSNLQANTDWYIGHETDTEYTISTAAELLGLSLVSSVTDFADKTVKLGADIIFNSGNTTTLSLDNPIAERWHGIGSKSKAFAGTLDGQSHTIYGLFGDSFGECSQGLFGNMTAKAVVKNLTIKNSIFYTQAGVIGSIASRGAGTFENIHSSATVISKDGSFVGGMVGQVITGPTKFKNCIFDGKLEATTKAGQYLGGMVAAMYNGAATAVTMEDCLVTAEINVTRENTGFINAGGMAGAITNTTAAGASLTIKDSLFAGKVTVNGGTTGGFGSVIGQIGVGTTATFENVYAVARACNEKNDLAIGAKNGTQNGGVVELAKKDILGENAFVNTKLDFENAWAAIDGQLPMLASYTADGMDLSGLTKASMDWYDPSATSLTIASKEDLLYFAILSSGSSFYNKTLKLSGNIELNENHADYLTWGTTAPATEWRPIGSDIPFDGTFDGNEMKVSGLYVKSTSANAGFFAQTWKHAVIKNIKLLDSHVESAASNVGIVVGKFMGTEISKVNAEGLVGATSSASINLGGIVGLIDTDVTEVNLNHLQFTGSVTGAGKKFAGIVGQINNSKVAFANILAKASVSTAQLEEGILGGLVAMVDGTSVVTGNAILSCGAVGAAEPAGSGELIGTIASTADVTVNGYAVSLEGMTGVGSGTNKGTVIDVNAEDIIGESAATELTNLDFTNEWKTVDGKTPILKCFYEEPKVTIPADTSWYVGHETDTEYTLSDLADFAGFANLSQTTDFADKTIKLDNSIVLNSGDYTTWDITPPTYEWTPIGKTSLPFAGTFDGQGNELIGFYQVIKTDASGGIFQSTASTAKIKNLSLTNSYFLVSGNTFGPVASVAGGTWNTIGVHNTIIEVAEDADVSNIGGVFGSVTEGATFTIIESMATIDTVSGDECANIGGVFGCIKADAIVSVVNTRATILPASDHTSLGGVIGIVDGGATLALSKTFSATSYNDYLTSAGAIAGTVTSGSTIAYDTAKSVYFDASIVTVAVKTLQGTAAATNAVGKQPVAYNTLTKAKGTSGLQKLGWTGTTPWDYDNTNKWPLLKAFIKK